MCIPPKRRLPRPDIRECPLIGVRTPCAVRDYLFRGWKARYLTCHADAGMMERMATSRWLDEDEQAAWRAYRQMNRMLYAELARDLTRDTGLSDPDYEVLSTLSEAAGRSLRASELGLLLQWSTSRVAHHIGRMERRGLVRREGCDDDGRGAVIGLTKVGLRAIQKAAPHHVAAVRRRFIDQLTREQLSALRNIGETITRHLDEMASGSVGARARPSS